MKQAVQRIFAAMAIPLFILFVMYALKTLEVGLDWDFTRLGVYPLQKKRSVRYFRSSLCTQRIQTSDCKFVALLFSILVSVLLLPRDRSLYILSDLDLLRHNYFFDR